MTVSDDVGRPDRKPCSCGAASPVSDSKGRREPLRCIWQGLRLLVQVNGVARLVQDGESPVSLWVHEALNFLLYVIRLGGW